MAFLIFINMIQDILRNRYANKLDGLDIYENKNSLILSKIIVKKEARGTGVGKDIMTDLINYADENKQIIALTPSSDFGGNLNKLRQFYKKFGFKYNKGQYKHFGFREAMIRYPRGVANENMKPLIKNLLREGLDFPVDTKKPLTESIMRNHKIDARKVADFVNFAKGYLKIDDDIKIALAFERTPDLTTTAYYNYSDGGFIKIYVKDRAIIDICRSIAHELVHHLQYLEERLLNAAEDGADGSDIENEANAVAGIIIRKWGKLHPEFYI